MRRWIAWAGLLIVLSRAAVGQGAAATTQGATTRAAATQGVKAEEVLKAKGLTKVGITYLLEGDVKLPEGLRAMRLVKRRIGAGGRTGHGTVGRIGGADGGGGAERALREVRGVVPLHVAAAGARGRGARG